MLTAKKQKKKFGKPSKVALRNLRTFSLFFPRFTHCQDTLRGVFSTKSVLADGINPLVVDEIRLRRDKRTDFIEISDAL